MTEKIIVKSNAFDGDDLATTTMSTVPGNDTLTVHHFTGDGFSEYNMICDKGGDHERVYVDQPGQNEIAEVAKKVRKLPGDWLNFLRGLGEQQHNVPSGGKNPITEYCENHPYQPPQKPHGRGGGR